MSVRLGAHAGGDLCGLVEQRAKRGVEATHRHHRVAALWSDVRLLDQENPLARLDRMERGRRSSEARSDNEHFERGLHPSALRVLHELVLDAVRSRRVRERREILSRVERRRGFDTGVGQFLNGRGEIGD